MSFRYRRSHLQIRDFFKSSRLLKKRTLLKLYKGANGYQNAVLRSISMLILLKPMAYPAVAFANCIH